MPQYIDKINLPGGREYDMRDSISEMKDVSISGLASGQALVYNGINWINDYISGSGSGITELGELDDVSLRTPVVTGDILRYDQDNRIWYNTRIPSELPSQTGNSGKFLTTNGSTVSWAEVQGGSGSGATTLADLTDTSVSGAVNGDHLIYRNGYWTAMKFRGFETASFIYVLSTSHDSEIILSEDGVGDYSICDYHVEIDGTIQLPTITIDELSTECVNFYLKNTNTSNPQGVNVRLVPGSNYIDYAIYDDGNIRYGASGIDINIPRNKVIELSIKAYNATNYDQVLAIVYSDPLTIQSI